MVRFYRSPNYDLLKVPNGLISFFESLDHKSGLEYAVFFEFQVPGEKGRQIDCLVISPSGMDLIEIKNWRNPLIPRSTGQWRELVNGQECLAPQNFYGRTVENPYEQARKTANSLEDYLKRKMGVGRYISLDIKPLVLVPQFNEATNQDDDTKDSRCLFVNGISYLDDKYILRKFYQDSLEYTIQDIEKIACWLGLTTKTNEEIHKEAIDQERLKRDNFEVVENFVNQSKEDLQIIAKQSKESVVRANEQLKVMLKRAADSDIEKVKIDKKLRDIEKVLQDAEAKYSFSEHKTVGLENEILELRSVVQEFIEQQRIVTLNAKNIDVEVSRVRESTEKVETKARQDLEDASHKVDKAEKERKRAEDIATIEQNKARHEGNRANREENRANREEKRADKEAFEKAILASQIEQTSKANLSKSAQAAQWRLGLLVAVPVLAVLGVLASVFMLKQAPPARAFQPPINVAAPISTSNPSKSPVVLTPPAKPNVQASKLLPTIPTSTPAAPLKPQVVQSVPIQPRANLNPPVLAQPTRSVTNTPRVEPQISVAPSPVSSTVAQPTPVAAAPVVRSVGRRSVQRPTPVPKAIVATGVPPIRTPRAPVISKPVVVKPRSTVTVAPRVPSSLPKTVPVVPALVATKQALPGEVYTAPVASKPVISSRPSALPGETYNATPVAETSSKALPGEDYNAPKIQAASTPISSLPGEVAPSSAQSVTCSEVRPVKGHLSTRGERVYFTTQTPKYAEIQALECFTNEDEAMSAGYKANVQN